MKKSILIILSACTFIFGSSLLMSCDNATTTSGETTEEHVHAEGEEHEHGETTTVETTTANADAQYTCPMKCEGDKTYASADDKCGKCGMDLALVEEAKTQTEEEHNHEH